MSFLLVVIYIVFISLGLPDSLFGVAWPVVHTEFGVAESFASLYSIITGVCTGGVSFFAGKVLRRFGTAKVTFVSILLTAMGLLGISFAPNLFVMMLFSVILGYGAGAIDTGVNNFVSLHFKARHMNWLHCFWGVGVTVSPMIMSAFLSGETGAWRNGYRVVAAMQLCIALIVAFSLRKWIRVEKAGVSAAAKTQEPAVPNEKSFSALLRTKGALVSILSLGLYCSMEFLIGTWGATYLVNAVALAPDAAAKWISVYFCGIMLGRLIAGFLSVKLKDDTLIFLGIGVSFCGILGLLLPLGTASLCGLLLIGIGFGPIFPSVLHAVPARFGKDYSADITGYHMGGAYAVGFGVQLAFGFIASATTFKITPFVLLGFCLCLFFAHTAAVRKTAHEQPKEK
ncbi:MAG: MFS transporter [Candidatus Fimenecus sp.]